MAVLARLWFHCCSTTGLVIDNGTGLRVKAIGGCFFPGHFLSRKIDASGRWPLRLILSSGDIEHNLGHNAT
jgi:hypothetical protein